jgi:hypothetical protein
MNHPKIYDSPERYFRAKQSTDDGMFNIYNVATNLRVGTLDAENADYRFTDDSCTISAAKLKDLANMALAIQPDWQPVDET